MMVTNQLGLNTFEKKAILKKQSLKKNTINLNNNLNLNENNNNNQNKPMNLESNKIKKTISKQSLFLFSYDNIFRLNILEIVTSDIFLKFINFINIISSFFLIFETNETFPNMTDILSKIFIAIYAFEFLLKIISFGFVLDENTYLRDPWNILDMIICFAGIITILPQISYNLFIIRAVRIIRPMKIIFVIPNMKNFIYTLIFSMVDIASVFMILFFFFVVFALLGLSLWSDIHDYRCRVAEYPINGTLIIDDNFPQLCGGTNMCNGKKDLCLSSKVSYNKNIYFMLNKDYLSNERDLFEKYISNKKNLQVVKNLHVNKTSENFADFHENNQYNDLNFDNELYNLYLNYGITTFRNFINALYIVFQSTTTEGWTDIMYQVMDANSYYLAIIYFFLLIIINNFFLLNLTVAVLLYNFEKNAGWDVNEKLHEKIIYEENKSEKRNSSLKLGSENGLKSNTDKEKLKNNLIGNININNARNNQIISGNNLITSNQHMLISEFNKNYELNNKKENLNFNRYNFLSEETNTKICSSQKNNFNNNENHSFKNLNQIKTNSNIINSNNILSSSAFSNTEASMLAKNNLIFSRNKLALLRLNANNSSSNNNNFSNWNETTNIPNVQTDYAPNNLNNNVNNIENIINKKLNASPLHLTSPNLPSLRNSPNILNKETYSIQNFHSIIDLNKGDEYENNIINNPNKKYNSCDLTQNNIANNKSHTNNHLFDKNKIHSSTSQPNVNPAQKRNSLLVTNMQNNLVKKLESTKKNLNKRQSLLTKTKIDDLQEKIKTEQNMQKKYRKKYMKIKEIEINKIEKNKTFIDSIKNLKKIKFFVPIKIIFSYHIQNRFAFYCYYILNQPIVQYIFYICISLNSIILALDRGNQSQEEKISVENLNIFLVGVFAFENILMLIGLGLKKFIQDPMNIWDTFVVIFSIIELSLFNKISFSQNSDNVGFSDLNGENMGNYTDINGKYTNELNAGNNNNAFKNTSISSVFRILRILRLFKLIRSWRSFRIMMMSIFEAMKRMINYFFLLCLFIYIYALIGCNLFKNSLKFNPDSDKYDPNAESMFDNFDNFQNSVLVVFYLFIGDGWYSRFFDCFRSEANNKIAASVYFISIVLFMQISLVNIFLAYLIDNFKLARKFLHRSLKIKNFLSNLVHFSNKKHNREFLIQKKNSKYKSTILALMDIYSQQDDTKSKYFLESKIVLNAKIKLDFVNLCAREEVYYNKDRGIKIRFSKHSRTVDLDDLFPVTNKYSSINYIEFYEFQNELQQPYETRASKYNNVRFLDEFNKGGTKTDKKTILNYNFNNEINNKPEQSHHKFYNNPNSNDVPSKDESIKNIVFKDHFQNSNGDKLKLIDNIPNNSSTNNENLDFYKNYRVRLNNNYYSASGIHDKHKNEININNDKSKNVSKKKSFSMKFRGLGKDYKNFFLSQKLLKSNKEEDIISKKKRLNSDSTNCVNSRNNNQLNLERKNKDYDMIREKEDCNGVTIENLSEIKSKWMNKYRPSFFSKDKSMNIPNNSSNNSRSSNDNVINVNIKKDSVHNLINNLTNNNNLKKQSSFKHSIYNFNSQYNDSLCNSIYSKADLPKLFSGENSGNIENMVYRRIENKISNKSIINLITNPHSLYSQKSNNKEVSYKKHNGVSSFIEDISQNNNDIINTSNIHNFKTSQHDNELENQKNQSSLKSPIRINDNASISFRSNPFSCIGSDVMVDDKMFDDRGKKSSGENRDSNKTNKGEKVNENKMMTINSNGMSDKIKENCKKQKTKDLQVSSRDKTNRDVFNCNIYFSKFEDEKSQKKENGKHYNPKQIVKSKQEEIFKKLEKTSILRPKKLNREKKFSSKNNKFEGLIDVKEQNTNESNEKCNFLQNNSDKDDFIINIASSSNNNFEKERAEKYTDQKNNDNIYTSYLNINQNNCINGNLVNEKKINFYETCKDRLDDWNLCNKSGGNTRFSKFEKIHNVDKNKNEMAKNYKIESDQDDTYFIEEKLNLQELKIKLEEISQKDNIKTNNLNKLNKNMYSKSIKNINRNNMKNQFDEIKKYHKNNNTLAFDEANNQDLSNTKVEFNNINLNTAIESNIKFIKNFLTSKTVNHKDHRKYSLNRKNSNTRINIDNRGSNFLNLDFLEDNDLKENSINRTVLNFKKVSSNKLNIKPDEAEDDEENYFKESNISEYNSNINFDLMSLNNSNFIFKELDYSFWKFENRENLHNQIGFTFSPSKQDRSKMIFKYNKAASIQVFHKQKSKVLTNKLENYENKNQRIFSNSNESRKITKKENGLNENIHFNNENKLENHTINLEMTKAEKEFDYNKIDYDIEDNYFDKSKILKNECNEKILFDKVINDGLKNKIQDKHETFPHHIKHRNSSIITNRLDDSNNLIKIISIRQDSSNIFHKFTESNYLCCDKKINKNLVQEIDNYLNVKKADEIQHDSDNHEKNQNSTRIISHSMLRIFNNKTDNQLPNSIPDTNQGVNISFDGIDNSIQIYSRKRKNILKSIRNYLMFKNFLLDKKNILHLNNNLNTWNNNISISHPNNQFNTLKNKNYKANSNDSSSSSICLSLNNNLKEKYNTKIVYKQQEKENIITKLEGNLEVPIREESSNFSIYNSINDSINNVQMNNIYDGNAQNYKYEKNINNNYENILPNRINQNSYNLIYKKLLNKFENLEEQLKHSIQEKIKITNEMILINTKNDQDKKEMRIDKLKGFEGAYEKDENFEYINNNLSKFSIMNVEHKEKHNAEILILKNQKIHNFSDNENSNIIKYQNKCTKNALFDNSKNNLINKIDSSSIIIHNPNNVNFKNLNNNSSNKEKSYFSLKNGNSFNNSNNPINFSGNFLQNLIDNNGSSNIYKINPNLEINNNVIFIKINHENNYNKSPFSKYFYSTSENHRKNFCSGKLGKNSNFSNNFNSNNKNTLTTKPAPGAAGNKNANLNNNNPFKCESRQKQRRNIMDILRRNIQKQNKIKKLSDYKKYSMKYCYFIIKSYITQSSLCILHRNSWIRKFIIKIILSKYFDFFISLIISLNTLLLILDNPWNNPDSFLAKCIFYANFFFTYIFLFEALLKILGLGFIFQYKKNISRSKLQKFLQNNSATSLSSNSAFYSLESNPLADKTNKTPNNLINNQNDKSVENIYMNMNDYKITNNIIHNDSNLMGYDKPHQESTQDLENHTTLLSQAYLRTVPNIIDFFVVILGLFDLFSDYYATFSAAKYFKALRLFRSLRPIRIFTKNQNLKIILSCLLKSIPAIGNTFIVCGVFIYIYAIIGIGLYKNVLTYHCSLKSFITDSDCLINGGSWIYNTYNFDDFLNSLKTLFCIMMVQGWVDVLNLAYQKTRNPICYVYFISFILFGYLFVLNLIISVVIEKYKSLKNKNSRLFTLSDEEKEWIKVQKIMLKFRPVPKIDMENASDRRKKLYKIITNSEFENVLIYLILISMVSLILQYNGASDKYNNILDLLNYIFTIIFNVELLVKLYVFRGIYFYSNWNKFDFILINLCNLIMIFNVLQSLNILNNYNQISNIAYIFRAFRILRVIRLMTVYRKLRGLIDTLVYLVPSILNIGTVMIIILIIYSCIGVNLFSTLPFRENFHQLNNFRDFISAFILLFRSLTGENWNSLMWEASYHECTGDYNFTSGYDLNFNSQKNFANFTSGENDYFCTTYANVTCSLDPNLNYTDLISGRGFSCGSDIAFFYFMSFMIVGPIFIMNLCIVMVVEGFSESMYENESLLSQEEMDNFISVWINYDTNFKKKVHPHELVLILKQLEPPLGLNYDRFYIVDPFKLNYSLRKVKKIKNLLCLYEKYFKNFNNFNSNKNNELTTNNNLLFKDKNETDKEGNIEYARIIRDAFNKVKEKEKDKNTYINKTDVIPIYINNNTNQLNSLKDNYSNNNRETMFKFNLNNNPKLKSLHELRNEFDEKFAVLSEERESPQITRVIHMLSNGNLKRLNNSYEIKNFFFSVNKKFWTNSIEIMQIMNFFQFAYTEEKKKNPYFHQTNSYNIHNKYGKHKENEFFNHNHINTKKLEKKNTNKSQQISNIDFIDNELYIHFVDACLALSRLVVSKKNTISLDMLRTNVVGRFTKKLWKNKFKYEKIENYFKNNHQLLSEKIGLRIISRVKNNLIKKLHEARQRIDIRKRHEEEQIKKRNLELLIEKKKKSALRKNTGYDHKINYLLNNTILQSNEINQILRMEENDIDLKNSKNDKDIKNNKKISNIQLRKIFYDKNNTINFNINAAPIKNKNSIVNFSTQNNATEFGENKHNKYLSEEILKSDFGKNKNTDEIHCNFYDNKDLLNLNFRNKENINHNFYQDNSNKNIFNCMENQKNENKDESFLIDKTNDFSQEKKQKNFPKPEENRMKLKNQFNNKEKLRVSRSVFNNDNNLKFINPDRRFDKKYVSQENVMNNVFSKKIENIENNINSTETLLNQQTIVYHKIYKRQFTDIEFYNSEDINNYQNQNNEYSQI